jgi:HAD superfamily hydrolase (TIGR01509 family)
MARMRSYRLGPEAVGVEDLALDKLAIHWREVLDETDEALDEIARSNGLLRFPSAELRERKQELRDERFETEVDLGNLARTAHLHLHRHLVGPRATGALLGLGPKVRACVFDLDGVLTPSTALHAGAWKDAFDELLARHHGGREQFGQWRPFVIREEYHRYIHGKPRLDGVHAFLASRGIRLPDGSPGDPPTRETAFGLANRKNELLVARLRHQGVQAYEGSVLFLELAHEAKLGCAVVSASQNTHAILERAGLETLVDLVIDGNTFAAKQLRPKPEPDSLVAACESFGVDPKDVAAFETTRSGVAAGRAAGTDRVVVVAREGFKPDAATWGADRVVNDLGELIDAKLI